jgi:shikimate 5-dehydrogenase
MTAALETKTMKQPKALDRRKFLLTLGAGGAATAAVIGAKVAGVAPAAKRPRWRRRRFRRLQRKRRTSVRATAQPSSEEYAHAAHPQRRR